MKIEEQNLKNRTSKLTMENEKGYYEKVNKWMEELFKSENYNTSELDSGQDQKVETEKMTVTLTTTKNQKKNINDINSTSIDIKECETLLRNYYNLSVNETLYMKKIDIVQEGMKTTKVQYEIYCKSPGTSLIKLNLTVCENEKISFLIPIKFTESLDKLKSSSGYYNDICYTTTSEDGTDITINDRKKEYISRDRIACQEDCDLLDYDYNTFQAKCECKVIDSSFSNFDIYINKTKLLKNLGNVKNFANYKFLA